MHGSNACRSIQVKHYSPSYPPRIRYDVCRAASGSCACAQSKCMFSSLLKEVDQHHHAVIQERVLQPKDVLFRQGMPATHLFMLRSGYVKVSLCLPDGEVQGLRIGHAGQPLGIEALGDQRYPYTVEALTEATVCRISYTDMAALMQNPAASATIIAALNQNLRDTWKTICGFRSRTSTARVADFLLTLVPPNAMPGQRLVQPLSRTDIAEMLGITMETVCRILSRLARERIIEAPSTGKYFRVLNQSKLAALAERLPGAAWPAANA